MQLDQNWKDKIEQQDGAINSSFQEIQKNHQEQYADLEERLGKKVNLNRKTKEILNLEYQLSVLINEKRYREAASIKKKILLKIEEAKAKNENQIKVSLKNQLQNLLKKQEQEKLASETKFISIRNELFSQREKDFETIHSKFNVFREKLEGNHSQEMMFKKKELRIFKAISDQFFQAAQN
jgi:nitrate/nitrite-specific signal transduction histidine kinase